MRILAAVGSEIPKILHVSARVIVWHSGASLAVCLDMHCSCFGAHVRVKEASIRVEGEEGRNNNGLMMRKPQFPQLI